VAEVKCDSIIPSSNLSEIGHQKGDHDSRFAVWGGVSVTKNGIFNGFWHDLCWCSF